jgi:UDP-galactopyranose mutase
MSQKENPMKNNVANVGAEEMGFSLKDVLGSRPRSTSSLKLPLDCSKASFPDAPDLVCLSHLRWDFVYQRPQHLLSRCAKSSAYSLSRNRFLVPSHLPDLISVSARVESGLWCHT